MAVKHCEETPEEEIQVLNSMFGDLEETYSIQRKIGAGTFSTVFKAIDHYYDSYENKWETKPLCAGEYEVGSKGEILRYVAIKRIYVTSQVSRIQLELQLLSQLRGSPNVLSVITAMRQRDQVLVITPFYPHQDFFTLCDNFSLDMAADYMRQLFSALAFVHEKRVLHRDIKPTNFLYNMDTKHGVLVDFGLAEYERSPRNPCVCGENGIGVSVDKLTVLGGVKKDEQGQSRRANRAGTRGFRAPEVLFKCQSQTTKIDVWSAGVTFLCLLTKRMPFFLSQDDGESLLELATIYGKLKMQTCGLLHGSVFETNVPTIDANGLSLDKVLYSCWSREYKEAAMKRGENNPSKFAMSGREKYAVGLMRKLMELDYRQRYSARDALQHCFFKMSDNKPIEDTNNHSKQEPVTVSGNEHTESSEKPPVGQFKTARRLFGIQKAAPEKQDLAKDSQPVMEHDATDPDQSQGNEKHANGFEQAQGENSENMTEDLDHQDAESDKENEAMEEDDVEPLDTVESGEKSGSENMGENEPHFDPYEYLKHNDSLASDKRQRRNHRASDNLMSGVEITEARRVEAAAISTES